MRQAKGVGFVAGAIVRHYTGNGDAEACVVIDRSFKECNCALFLFVRHHLREGHTRSVIDADVDELPTWPRPPTTLVALTSTIARNAMAATIDPTELFDVEWISSPGCSRS
jgi:hypothetical protein